MRDVEPLCPAERQELYDLRDKVREKKSIIKKQAEDIERVIKQWDAQNNDQNELIRRLEKERQALLTVVLRLGGYTG